MWKIEILAEMDASNAQNFLEGVLQVAVALLGLFGVKVTASSVLKEEGENA